MHIDPPSSNVILSQDTPEAAMEKPLRITGSPESVETAKQLVTEVLANGCGRGSAGAGGGFFEMMVPRHKVGSFKLI